MGTRRNWLFEGSASGTAATTALVTCTPGAVPATLVSPGTGGTIQFNGATIKEGSSSVQFVPAVGVSCVVRLPLAASNTQGAFTFYSYGTALPGATTTIFTARHSSGVALRVNITSTGTVQVADSANAIVASSAVGAWAANRWNRISVVMTVATSTTGVFSVNVYDADSTTSLASLTSSAANLGTAALVACDVGVPGVGPTGGWTSYVDAVQMEDGATAEIGPYATAAVPPTLTVSEGTYYVVDVRTSTAGSGGTLAYTITQVSGSAFTPVVVVTGVWAIERDTAADRAYTVTATESPSTLTDSQSVTVPMLSQFVSTAEMVWTGTVWE